MPPRTRPFPALSLVAMIAAAALPLACGETRPGDRDDEVGTSEQQDPLLGGLTLWSDCTTPQKDFLLQAHRYGRIAAASRAFEQCVELTMSRGVPGTGPYRQCNGDPFYGSSLDVQRDAVLDAARSANGVGMFCSGASSDVLASAPIGAYDGAGLEVLSWSAWLASSVASLSLPVCADDAARRAGGCRWAAAPWPYSQAAGVIWHEALHNRGYTHGANDQPAARVACGYPTAADSEWHFQVNTLPYMVGNCIGGVLDLSGFACPGMATACPPGQLRLVTGVGATTCECVGDASSVATRASGALSFVATAANVSGAALRLDAPGLDDNPDAIVHFTHVWNPSGATGPYNGNRTVASYDASSRRWQLVNTNGAPMPLGAGFNVRVGRGARVTVGATTTRAPLDHLLANGDAAAILTVSPGASPTPIDDAPAVSYDGARWNVVFAGGRSVPAGARFFVDAETSHNRGLHFTHVATSASVGGNVTRLDSPLLNGNPRARLLVTQQAASGATVASDLGVYYDGWRWAIYTERGGSPGPSIPVGARFSVELLRDEVSRWVMVEGGATGVDTGIDLGPTDVLAVRGSGIVAPGPPFAGVVHAEGASPASSGFPLAWNRYALIGRVGAGPWLGVGRRLTPAGGLGTGRVWLRTNDDTPGNASGFFQAETRAFR